MTSDSSAPELTVGHIATGDKGLKADALGFMSNPIGGLLLGIPLMLIAFAKFRPYFRRKTEVSPPGII